MLRLVLIALAVFVVVLMITCYALRSRRRCPNIPLVSNVPIVGGLLVLSTFKPDNLHLKFGEFVSRYGNNFRAEVFGVNVIVSADRQVAAALLSSPRHLHKHKLYLLLGKWLGNGLLLSHGRAWQTMRKILSPTFHFQILEEFMAVFDKQCAVFLDKLEKHAGDGHEAVDISGMVGLLTLDTIAETAMGVQIKAQQNEHSQFVTAIKQITNVLFTRLMRPLLVLPWLFALCAPRLHRQQTESIAFLHAFNRGIIEQRHAALLGSTLPPKRHQALLDVLLQASSDEGQPLSYKQIEDEVNTFMFEGHDTTAAAVSFCLYLLSRHPRVQRKLYAEIAQHFGSHVEDRPLRHEDFQQLPYLNCVVRESLRVYPPIPAIGRWLQSDLPTQSATAGCLPAGCNVILLLWQLLRDPELYPSPESFEPERFMTSQGVEAAKQAYGSIPFSAGPRNCIGQRFALMEIKTIVIRTLQRFELCEAGEPVQPLIRFVLSSKSGVNVGLRLRGK